VYFKASLEVFEPNVAKTVVQYVIKVVDADNANAALSKNYTYVIDYSIKRSVRNFFYVNSLGAVDELATYGKGSKEIEYYKDSAEVALTDLGIEAQEQDYNIEAKEFYEAATGFRSKRELAYMKDFFLSSNKFVKKLGQWLPIILSTKRVREAEDGRNLAGYKFEYSLAYKDDSLSEDDLSDIIGYPLPPQGFLGGGNVTLSITEPAAIVIDAMPTIGSSNAVSSNGVAVSLAGKQNIIAVGTELQYIRGDGTLGTLGSEVSVLGGSVFEDKWAVKNTAENLALGYGSGNIAIGNFENDSLTKVLGRFGLENAANFLGQFSVANITDNTTYVLPNNQIAGVININDWNYLLNKPITFSPSSHSHIISEVTDLPATLETFVTLGTGQTITGVKLFTGGRTEVNQLYLRAVTTPSLKYAASAYINAYVLDTNVAHIKVQKDPTNFYPLNFEASSYNFLRGNISYVGQLKPQGVSGSTGKVLRTDGTNDAWGFVDWSELTTKPANVTAIAALTGGGFAKRLTDGTWQLDATQYATQTNLEANYQPKLTGEGYVKIVSGATTYVNKEFVDLTTAQSAIAGAKKFTTSIEVFNEIDSSYFRVQNHIVVGVNFGIKISHNQNLVWNIAKAGQAGFVGYTMGGVGTSPSHFAILKNGLRLEKDSTNSTVMPTESLDVIGNQYITGVFKPSGSAPSATRQVLMSNGTTAMQYSTVVVSDISDFSAGWNTNWDAKMALSALNFGATAQVLTVKSATKFEQNIEFSPTIIDRGLVFGNGYFKNNSAGNGFEYKSSTAIGSSSPDYRTGNFRFVQLTANRTWDLPNYDGTLTTYEKINSEFWKLGSNIDMTADGVFDIVSKYDLVGETSVQRPPFNYLWKINGTTKMQLTPQGNLGVGGITPEAVIHAHANVVGSAEVIALKASNNVTSAYFSIGIDSTNNRANLYSGGEVWATTISKFKFGVADVSGLWTYSVIPQTTADATTGNQLVRLSQVQTLLSGGFAVSTACKLVFIDNQSLSGAKTQGGYTTATNDYALFTGQSTAAENGVRKYNGSTWVRPTENDADGEIRGKGHLVTAGTYAASQWVNTNASSITVDTTAITYVQWTASETDPTVPAYTKTLLSAAQLLTEIKTVDGVASGLDSQYLGGYNYDNYPRKSENATITGNWTHSGTLTIAIPSASTDAARKDYVDAGLATKVSINGNTYGAAFSIGTVDGYNIALIRGSVTQAVLRSDGIGDVKKLAVGRASGFGNTSWEATAVFGGNVVIGGNNSGIQASYDLNMVAHTTLDTANNGTRKSKIKFGYYSSFEYINRYNRGIEYSRADGSIVIGSYSDITDTATTAPIEASSFYFSSDGKMAIGQADYESKKLLVNGNARIKGELDLTGRLSLNGSYGVDHNFVKYNGTSVVWAALNTGELS
ncbi:hypothetical protein, partial [Emticicia sp.]|uniref:hypothetical protein n=1 Tax=Emticicia sp. TaxID=1930953 RepID=UPI003751B91F